MSESLSNRNRYINRELSHLSFHLRVLAQATSERHPLLERLKFLLIFSNNLDEFFEIRVAGLQKLVDHGTSSLAMDDRSPQETLNEISKICHYAINEQYKILNEKIFPALAQQNIRFIRRSEWTQRQKEWVYEYFQKNVLPVVSPIGLDPAHPFPRLANKSLNFIVSLKGRDAFGRHCTHAILPAPKSLPRIIPLPPEIAGTGQHYIFLSGMIHAFAAELFPGMTIRGCYQFRLTRNADLHFDEDIVEDLAIALKGELSSRRYGDAVRLEVADNCPPDISDFLLQQFELDKVDLYRVNGMVNLSRMMPVTELNIPHLRYRPFRPALPAILQKHDSIFEALQKKDILLHHPFESFETVIDFLRQAAKDPDVLAIKQTFYRTGQNSDILNLLMEAARRGKEVTAIIELRARFDEEYNLEIADRLQRAGAIVCYGIVGYKTHAKMLMVVRREGDVLRRYVHLGTGNYHAKNAKLYTDYSLLTTHPEICNDVNQLFQQLTSIGKSARTKWLYHAPFTLHRKILQLINTETKNAQEGKYTEIILKVNALTERQIIDALYEASQAGVKITLIVRSICCLKPGIAGLSENIRVISIVGRFLEHTRIYFFHNNGDRRIYLSSADLMDRNLMHRIETCFPILDPDLFERVFKQGLEPYMQDTEDSWLLKSNGQFQQVTSHASPDDALHPSAQRYLLQLLSSSYGE